MGKKSKKHTEQCVGKQSLHAAVHAPTSDRQALVESMEKGRWEELVAVAGAQDNVDARLLSLFVSLKAKNKAPPKPPDGSHLLPPGPPQPPPMRVNASSHLHIFVGKLSWGEVNPHH